MIPLTMNVWSKSRRRRCQPGMAFQRQQNSKRFIPEIRAFAIRSEKFRGDVEFLE
jgi:hypothetical protein